MEGNQEFENIVSNMDLDDIVIKPSVIEINNVIGTMSEAVGFLAYFNSRYLENPEMEIDDDLIVLLDLLLENAENLIDALVDSEMKAANEESDEDEDEE